MVVKPLSFIANGQKGLLQPAVKCRGPEYLRIIYGPEYSLPENLDRLRARGLSSKRSLALREFALGLEALDRFIRREPLRRVHECVFGVLALESEREFEATRWGVPRLMEDTVSCPRSRQHPKRAILRAHRILSKRGLYTIGSVVWKTYTTMGMGSNHAASRSSPWNGRL